METNQIFQKDFSQWTSSQKEQIQIFFLFNQFFSKFYQKKKFNQIVKMCYFRKINLHQELYLQNNNRPEAIILLSGKIIIKKKENQHFTRNKKLDKNKKINNQLNNQVLVRNIGKCTQYNQVFRLNNQCIIQSFGSSASQIIFVPCSLYNKLIENIQIQRVDKIEKVLSRFFSNLRKKDLHSLSQTNCLFKQFRMNNYIYRAADKPQEVFILLQGMLKLQKPGFSHKTMQQTIIINPQRIFGEKDIRKQQRQHNAVCCTAHVQVLSIPKNAFFKYVGVSYSQEQSFKSIERKSLNLPRTLNVRISHKNTRYINDSFDFITKRQSSSKQKIRQYELVKNSHMLLDISPKSKKKFSIKSSQILDNQIPQFKDVLKMRNKIHRSVKRNKNEFDLSNSLEKQLNLHK